MIPNVGCDPKINIVSVGAKILEKLKVDKVPLEKILTETSADLHISLDHIILTMDWLYTIKAINFKGNEVGLNETKHS